jgi:hypothetical protein
MQIPVKVSRLTTAATMKYSPTDTNVSLKKSVGKHRPSPPGFGCGFGVPGLGVENNFVLICVIRVFISP